MQVDYDAIGYTPRTKYIVGGIISNETTSETLYLLPDDDSVKFFVKVMSGMSPIQDAYVTITKFFTGEGVFKTIGTRKTDSDGRFIEYLELDKTYKFLVIKNGELLGTFERVSICESAPCEITLQLVTAEAPEETEINLWEGFYDVFAQNVTYSLTFNKTTKIITFDFIDNTGLAKYFKLTVNYAFGNETGEPICEKILYSTAGTMTCNLTGYYGNFVARAVVARSPEKLIKNLFITLQGLEEAIGNEGLLISLLIIVTIAMVGVWSPPVGIILMVFALFAVNLLGISSLSMTTIGIMLILGLIIIWRMKTYNGNEDKRLSFNNCCSSTCLCNVWKCYKRF
jgi:hypothetical protein